MILSAVWGGAFTLNKLALNFYSPEFIVFARNMNSCAGRVGSTPPPPLPLALGPAP